MSKYILMCLLFQVAMVEIQIDDQDSISSTQPSGNVTVMNSGDPIPQPLLIGFVVCTTLLVTVHLVALMISTCILPNIEAVSNVHSVQAVNESPHDQMRHCVEMAWICSTGLGILLFLAELAVLCWVKFYHISKAAATASTAIVIPAGILFIVFSLMFYRKLVAHKYQRHTEGLRELDEMARELNSCNPNERLNVV